MRSHEVNRALPIREDHLTVHRSAGRIDGAQLHRVLAHRTYSRRTDALRQSTRSATIEKGVATNNSRVFWLTGRERRCCRTMRPQGQAAQEFRIRPHKGARPTTQDSTVRWFLDPMQLQDDRPLAVSPGSSLGGWYTTTPSAPPAPLANRSPDIVGERQLAVKQRTDHGDCVARTNRFRGNSIITESARRCRFEKTARPCPSRQHQKKSPPKSRLTNGIRAV